MRNYSLISNKGKYVGSDVTIHFGHETNRNNSCYINVITILKENYMNVNVFLPKYA